jgi:hypothetical protein
MRQQKLGVEGVILGHAFRSKPKTDSLSHPDSAVKNKRLRQRGLDMVNAAGTKGVLRN